MLNAHATAQLDALAKRRPELIACIPAVAAAAEAICATHRRGGKILFCGNGGSAADCDHLVGELAKSFEAQRAIPAADLAKLRAAGDDRLLRMQPGLAAFSLAAQSGIMTAIANDIDPALIFAQQVYACGRAGDCLVGISTSGNSANVVLAAKAARALGLTAIGVTGSAVCKLDEVCSIMIKAPATTTAPVQEHHLPLHHALCAAVEQELFGGQAVGKG